MDVKINIPLSTLTTMRLGGPASYVANFTNEEELQQLCQNAKKLGQPVYVIGGGSNLIAHDEGFAGVILVNKIKGIEVLEDTPSGTTIAAGGGETWDDLVKYCVDLNITGIEALSGIPGTVGAAPVQNIGAYGQELSGTFVSLDAYDTKTDGMISISWEECKFGYRDSIFRSGDMVGRYIITRVTLSLTKERPEPPFYKAIEEYLSARQIGTMNVTPQIIRTAVLEIRGDKLPDPKVTPSAGSFFKNAIVDGWKATDIAKEHPEMPSYTLEDGRVKIPSGWLIDSCNLRGEVLHGMKIHDRNAVVLINESATSYADLAAAREEIIGAVRDKFQIILEQEPLEL